MPLKEPENIVERVVVEKVSVNRNNINYKSIQAASTKSTKAPNSVTSEFEDFIKSEEFLGVNSLFVRYGFHEDENEVFNTQSTTASEDITEDFDTPPNINDSSGSDFNLGSEENLITQAEENLVSEELQQFLLSLPNQIRALLLYQLNFVKKLKGVPTSDLIQNLKTQAAMNINYFKLVRVEIHDGYEVSENGQLMLNQPRYRLLKESDVINLRDSTLCRIMRYYNNDLKIKRDMLSFAIQGQHFLLRPLEPIKPTSISVTKQQQALSIGTNHLITKNYNLAGATSNIMTQPAGVSTMTPEEEQEVAAQANRLPPAGSAAETQSGVFSPSQSGPAATPPPTSTGGGSSGGGY